MTEPTLAEAVADMEPAVISAAKGQLHGDASLAAVAERSGMPGDAMLTEVLGFWLQAIQTDLTLGTTVAIEQNLGWLRDLRAAQHMPFDDALVWRMFAAISGEIDAGLTADEQRIAYDTYRRAVEALIVADFPGAVGRA